MYIGKPAKEIDTLIVDYFLRFGSKDCCFEDLQPYLKEVHIDSAKKIIEKFKATIDESCDDDKVIGIFFLRFNSVLYVALYIYLINI